MPGGTIGALGRQLERLFTTGVVAGLTEDQLLDRFISRRDEAAFAALVSRYGPMVLGVCRQLLRDPNDVDDAFQATFLILVRKAGSLRRRDLLGNWLYGVAYRVAVRSRAIAARRAATETTDNVDSLATTRDPPALLPELHEELQRLPESYRVAVVLCYLEGLTHDEAATRLGWPIGTVKGRLARARELLRTRLTRRGLAPAVGAIAIETLARDAHAAVPASLFGHTIKAASLVATGRLAAAGLISSQVVALTEGVIHAMSLAKLKTLAVAMALASSMVTGAGVLAYQGTDRGKKDDDRTTPRASAESGKPVAASDAPPERKAQENPDLNPVMPNILQTRNRIDERQFNSFIRTVRPIDWDVRKVDRLFHWSRAMKEAEEYLFQCDPALARNPDTRNAALTAHRDRMRLLHEVTQKLSGPDQPQIADVARVAMQQAQRDLDSAPSTTVVVAKDGEVIVKDNDTELRATATRLGRLQAPTAEKPDGAGAKAIRPAGAVGAGGFGGDNAAAARARSQENKFRQIIATLGPLIAGEDKSPRTKRILTKLEEPVSMSFAEETPLEDVLKYIKSAVQGPNDTGIPIYVDPVGLAEAEKTMTSPVTIDLEGIPLKTTLRLLLKQLGLAFCVKDDILMISSVDGIYQELLESSTEEQKTKAGVVGPGRGFQ